MKLVNTKNRILQYLEYKDISKAVFYDTVGIKRGLLDKDKLEATVSDVVLAKILVTYPEISPEWLISGSGNMIKDNESISVVKKQLVCENHTVYNCIPLIPYDAWAGNGSPSFSDEKVETYYKVPDFHNADFLLRVKGNSMSPLLKERDLVACKKITQFEHNHKVHALYTKSMGVLIKRVMLKDNGTHITLISENIDYSPFDIPLEDIQDIAIVIGAITFP